MRFSQIHGYEKIKQSLVGMADSGRVAHAMLLYENDGCGAFALAWAYAQYLSCENPSNGDSCGKCPSCNRMSKLIHPDLHLIFPTNSGSKSGKTAAKDITSAFYMEYFRELARENPYFLEPQLMETLGLESKSWDVNVAQAKELSHVLSLSSMEKGWKTVIFYLPENLNIQAANKLLKLVEEPPEMTLFLFITHHPQRVLQTIFSRCQSLRLPPLSESELSEALSERGYTPEAVQESVRQSAGSMGVALSHLENQADDELYFQWFTQLLQALLKKDLLEALSIGEQIAEQPSREKQKAFCIFASDMLRKIFLMQRGMADLSYTSAARMSLCQTLSSQVSRNFSTRMLPVLDKLVYYMDRNVNRKILFTDLINRMSINI
ncbi:MAG: hypothetical protein II364_05710 [Bacteroidales bacterium]|jgi:DNA polymerase-3 subunit delta'|nr:hypothetical protein [Bacteroidales bacterium]